MSRRLDLDRRSRVTTSVVALLATLLATAGLPGVAASPAAASVPVGYDPVLVSASEAGIGGGGRSTHATVSDDGRLVAFQSTAADLFVTPDGFTTPAVHLKDLETGEIRWVSAPAPGGVATPAFAPSISGDGRFVVFGASPDPGSELVAGITGPGLYRYEVATGAVEHLVGLRVGTGEESAPTSVSADGSVVAFWSAAPALDPALPPTLDVVARQLFVWEEATGTTRWINRPTGGAPPIDLLDHTNPFGVSGDGSTVMYTSMASNPASGDTDGDADVFAFHLPTGSTTLVSGPTSQGAPIGDVRLAGRDAISHDGGKLLVELVGDASQFNVLDGDGQPDILFIDRFGPVGVSFQTSFPDPGECTGWAGTAAMDADASHVVFAADCGDGTNLYRVDSNVGPVLISRQPDGRPWNGLESGEDPARPTITMSADGRLVVFEAEGYDLVGARGDVDVVALREGVGSGGDPRASLATSGVQLTGASTEPAVSDDGRYVAFLAEAGPPGSVPLAPGQRAAYVKDRTTGVLTKVPDTILAEQASSNPFDHSAVDISGDGRTVVVGAGTGSFDKAVFAWHRDTGETSLVFSNGSESNLDGIEELSVSDDGTRVALVFDAHAVGASANSGVVSQFDGTAWTPIDSFGTHQSGVSISGDGSTVVWTDRAPQVPGMVPNPRFDDPRQLGAREVYARRVDTGETQLVSATPGSGGLGTAQTSSTGGNHTDGSHHAVSDDGSRVAFVAGTPLDQLGQAVVDRNGDLGEDVVLADLDAGSLRVVSLYGPSFGVGPAPETCPGPLSGAAPTISDDGRVVTFSGHCVPSFSSFTEVRGVLRQVDGGFVEQVPVGDAPGQFDVFSAPRAAPATSADGGIVVAAVDASLVPADTNGAVDVYVAEPGAPPPPADDPRASTTQLGEQASGDSTDPAMSDDGRRVAFLSTSSDLVPGGPADGLPHLYVKDRDTGDVRWIDRFDCFQCAGVGDDGTEVVAFDLSGDGEWVVYAVEGPGTAPGSTTVEIWRERIGTDEGSIHRQDHVGDVGGVDDVGISDDGGRVVATVFGEPPSPDPAAPVTGGLAARGVYLWDGGDGWSPLSVTGSGGAPDGESIDAAISGDGQVATFVTEATDLAGLEGSSGAPQLVRTTIGTGAFESLATDLAADLDAVATGERHRMSDDGSVVAFTAERLVDGSPRSVVEVWRDAGPAQRLDPECAHTEGAAARGRARGSARGTAGDFSRAFLPSVSDDGRVVAFHWQCQPVTGEAHPVVVRTVDDGPPEVLSSTGPHDAADGHRDVALSGDGRVAAFDTPAELFGADTNDTFDVYVVERAVPPPPDGLPEPVDDTATTFPGVPVDTPVLANDGGELDPSSLEVLGVDVGTTEIVGEGIGSQIRYTPPVDFTGTATVTYRLTGPGGTAEAALRVTVVALGPTPLDLVVDGEAPFDLGGTGTAVVEVRNATGAEVAGAVVTVAAAPASIDDVVPTDPRWSCAVAPDATSATCSLPAVIAAGTSVPSLRVEVALPEGVPYPHCDAVAGSGPHCVLVAAWNGGAADRDTATPDPVEERLEVRGDIPTVELLPPDTVTEGQPAEWRVSAATTLGGSGATGAMSFRFRAANDGSAFVTAASSDAGWSCVADPADPRSALCTYADWPEFDLGPGLLTLTFTTGTGTPTGCVGVAGPCTSVVAGWTDGTFGGEGSVVLDEAFATVEEAGSVDAPDLAVDLSHPAKVGAGLDTTFSALARNVGDDPTTGPVTLTVQLPAGLVPRKAAGKGWSCTVDPGARTATCSTAATLGEGSALAGVNVAADVADDAPDGVATAEVATAGDLNAANDVDTDAVDVTPLDEQQDGILGLSIVGPELISKGQTVELEARAVNPGGAAVDGPTSFSVVVPDGLPAGQRLTASARGDGWTCATTQHKGSRLLRCTTRAGVPAGSETAPVTIHLTADDVVEGATVDLPFTVTSRTRSTRLSTQLRVVDGSRAVLGVEVDATSSLFAGKEGSVLVSVTNRGRGPATGPTVVEIERPAGVEVARAEGERWECTVAARVTCRNLVPLRSAMTTEPLVLTLAAGSDAADGSVELTAAASAPDRFGTVRAEGVGVLLVESPGRGGVALERDGSIAETDARGDVRYPLTAVNQGTRLVRGGLTVVEQLPAGAKATANGPGWSCASTDRALTCTRPPLLLPGGAAAPPIEVALDLPLTAAGTTQRVIGTARASDGSSATSAAAFLVPRPPAPAPAATTTPALTPSLLTRGAGATAGATLTNTGRADLPAGTLVGLVLPDGSTGLSPTGSGLACRSGVEARAVVACRTTAALAPGRSVTADVPFEVAAGAPDEVALAVGEVRLPAGSVSDPLDAAVAQLLGRGAAGLTRASTDRRPVSGVVADAGDDQEVLDLTPRPDGISAPTVVALDGTSSHGGAGPLRLTWVQTSGPAVDWEGDVTTRPGFPAGAPAVEVVEGAQPTFVVPRIEGDLAVDLEFELTARDPAGIDRTDTVAVRVAPAPNRAPTLQPITASIDGDEVPPAGATIEVASRASDPDGDPLAVRWEIAGGDGNLAAAGLREKGEQAFVTWPKGTSFLIVEVTVDDGRGGRDSETITLGDAPEPLGITAAGPPTPVGAGEEIVVTADAGRADPDGLFWVWEQVSGPAVDPVAVFATDGPVLRVDAPAAAVPGDAVVLRVTASRGSGAGASAADALVTVRLAPTPGPTIAVLGSPAVGRGQDLALTAAVTAAAPFTVVWRQVSGPGGSLSSTTGTATTFRLDADAVAEVRATVTDAAGRTASATLPIVVGAPFVPDTTTVSCAQAASLAGRAFAAATAGERLSGTVGPVSFDLGTLAVENPCGQADARLVVEDASIGIGGIVSGTGLSGTMTETRLCLTGGDLRLPEDWGVSAVELAPTSPLCLVQEAGSTRLEGSLTVTGLPFLPLPDGVPPPTTTIELSATGLRVVADATIPTGGTVHVELDSALGSSASPWSASAVVDDLAVFGRTLDLSGSIEGTGGSISTFDVRGSLPGPIVLVPGAELTDLELAWDPTALAVRGRLSLGGGAVVLDAAGRIRDADRWDLTVSGAAGQPGFSPMPELTLDPVGFAGTVTKDGPSLSDITFDVQLAVSGDWAPVPALSMRQLTAQLSNLPAPTDCPGIEPGGVWFRLTGTARVDVGTEPIEVAAAACVGFGEGAWSIGATATFGSWTPVDGIPVSVESLGISVSGVGLDVTIAAHGGVRVLGVDLGAKVTFDTTDLSIVVDGFGDLSAAGVGLAPGSVGHVVLASADVPDHRFDDPVLDGVTGVSFGLSLFAGFAPDPALDDFLVDVFGLPPITALVVSAELGANVTLKAAISLGGDGIPLFATCPAGACTIGAPDTTSLALTELALSISLSGRIGFAATARLNLPASPDGATPASELSLTAEIAIDLAGPAITLALFTSDGTWNGALGVAGLNLADLAIQGGVNFASPVPVPTVGFGATVVNLPAPWAAAIGAPTDPAQQEAMSFVLNISQTAPVLAIHVGEEDGNVALRPLQAIPGQADTLQVDHAELVVAPFGGQVGPYVFEPGLSLGFAGVVAGVDVDVAARVTLLPPALDAELSVGPISLGGVTIRDIEAELHLDTTGFSASFDGAVDLPAGMPTMSAGVDVTAGASGIRSAFTGTVANWQFGPFARLDSFTVSAEAGLSTLDATPQFSFAAAGAGNVLGTPVAVSGTAAFSGGALSSASLRASVGTFRIGPPGPAGVAVGGRGCDGVAGTADDGACVSVAFDRALPQPFSGGISGAVTVAGLTATIDGTLDATGLAASATLDARQFGSLAMSGRFYSGAPAALAGRTETRPDGSVVGVQTGDWVVRTTAGRTGKLSNFDVTLAVAAGSLGGSPFVAASGSTSVLGNTVAIRTNLSLVDGQLRYRAEADTALTIDGYSLASGHLVLDSATGMSFEGDVTLQNVGTIRLRGAIRRATPTSAITYDLTVDAAVSMLGTTAAGSFRLRQGTLDVAVDLDSGGFDFAFSGSVQPSIGRFCVEGSTTLQLDGPNVSGWVKYCNRSPQSGFKGSGTVLGYTVGPVSISVPDFTLSRRFGPYGGEDSTCFLTGVARVCLGMDADFDVDVEISVDDGFSVDGSGSANAFARHWVYEDWEWKWVRTNLFGVGLRIDEEDREACATVSAFGQSANLCA